MVLRLAFMAFYASLLLVIGIIARPRARHHQEEYFLASRSLPGWVLFLTMAATNFSAFTVYGFSGAGWQMGYGFYPIMAFGTGFMALAFLLIGVPVWRLGKEHGLVTPPEFAYQRSASRTLRVTFLVVMTAFTLPYLALQPMAAGYALEALLGIPYYAGAAITTAVVVAYVVLGGFRGEVWTDAFQGLMMISIMALALVVVAGEFGGISEANRAVAATWPELFGRPGLGSSLTPGVWFGYMCLWFLCDPMFPQLFQRYYAARDPRSLAVTAALYPLLTGFLFLLPVSIGVIARLAFPTLPAGVAADRILPLVLHAVAPAWVETLVVCAGLAALVTTLDSQLLTLSSMAVRDVWEPLRARISRSPSVAPPSAWVGRGFVIALALAGLGIACRPPGTFVEITTETFTGLAVLFPTVVAALYWRRFDARAAVASIVVGEALVLAYHEKWLPTFGTLPVVPVVVGATCVLVLGCVLLRGRGRPPVHLVVGMSRRSKILWSAAFLGLFVAANDFWAWGDARLGPLGLPWWTWACAALCLLLSLLLWLFGRVVRRRN